jgi:hypothetical protein
MDLWDILVSFIRLRSRTEARTLLRKAQDRLAWFVTERRDMYELTLRFKASWSLATRVLNITLDLSGANSSTETSGLQILATMKLLCNSKA